MLGSALQGKRTEIEIDINSPPVSASTHIHIYKRKLKEKKSRIPERREGGLRHFRASTPMLKAFLREGGGKGRGGQVDRRGVKKVDRLLEILSNEIDLRID